MTRGKYVMNIGRILRGIMHIYTSDPPLVLFIAQRKPCVLLTIYVAMETLLLH